MRKKDPRKEIEASGIEGAELIDALEHFIAKALDMERSLGPIWAIPADAPDRVQQIDGYMVGLPFFSFMEPADRVLRTLQQARRWFLQLGFSVDETDRKVEGIKLAVGLVAGRIWMTALLVDPRTPLDQLRNVLGNRKEYEPFMRMGMENLPRILEHLRELLASRKWLLPRPRIVREKSGRLMDEDASEIELASAMDAFAAAAMEMRAHATPLVDGPILEACLRFDALRPVDRQPCISLIEAFGCCALILSRAAKLFWRLCGPEWSTELHDGICSIVTCVKRCALFGEKDDHWDTHMKIIYAVSQWLHREAEGEYANDRTRSQSDLWGSLAEAMRTDVQSDASMLGENQALARGERDGVEARTCSDPVPVEAKKKSKLRTKERNPNVRSRQYTERRTQATGEEPRVLIVTALPVEFEAVKHHVGNVHEEKGGGTVYEVGQFRASRGIVKVIIVEAGAGNPEAGIETAMAIWKFKPGKAFFAGIGGGMKDVKIGDVVVAECVHYYEKGKDTGDGLQTRPGDNPAAHEILQAARAIIRDRNTRWRSRVPAIGERCSQLQEPHAFIKPIAAGEKVVASEYSATARLIGRSYNDTILVETEGKGFFVAAHRSAVPAAVVRGVSDMLKAPSDLDEATRQKAAAQNAAAFVFELIHRLF